MLGSNGDFFGGSDVNLEGVSMISSVDLFVDEVNIGVHVEEISDTEFGISWTSSRGDGLLHVSDHKLFENHFSSIVLNQ